MNQEYSPPLAISFVWNPSDNRTVEPVIDALIASFARNKDRPFSRGLNIPLFLFSSLDGAISPAEKPENLATQNIVFVFTSINTLGHPSWKQYVESLPVESSFHIIPVAVDTHGLTHSGSLRGLNCVRMYDWPQEYVELYAAVSLSHEIYRFGLSALGPDEKGKSSSINIFLSHAKAGDTGRLHSERIKLFIDNTNMSRFFDANEIAPGFLFDEEIKRHIQSSTLVALESDAYSSRYWCQREVLLAKEQNRPILVVNCLEEYEDRIFPAASNVPCIHISASSELSDKDILRILSATILETIRFGYSMKCLEEYRRAGWIEIDCALVARPPEIRQVIELKNRGLDKICYPEPPIYSEEADWHEYMQIEAFTPLWNKKEQNCLSKARVGLSVSDITRAGYSSEHLHGECLVRISQELARHLLARSATLIYGGDLRPGGFTEFVLDEARILNARIRDTGAHVENHLAWPLYISDPEITSWRARFHDVMATLEHEIPPDLSGEVDNSLFLSPSCAYNSYVWSRCLTTMRKASVSSSHARICAGGRVVGYKGSMPGVLEEVIIALDQNKPLYLLGGFGGIVKDICKAIVDGVVPLSLTADWQISNNEGYGELQKIAYERGFGVDYAEIAAILNSAKLSDLASACGLSVSDYKRLMTSRFTDECVHIVLKGMRAISH